MEEKKTIWNKIKGSFDNVTKWAFSARKLTAFAIMLCILVGHGFYYKHCYLKEDFSLFDTILIIDYVAVAFFLGLITVQQIVELKNGKKDENKPETPQPAPANNDPAV